MGEGHKKVGKLELKEARGRRVITRKANVVMKDFREKLQ